MTFHFIISLSTVKLKTTATRGDYVIMESAFVNRMKWFNKDGQKWRNMEELGKRLSSIGVDNRSKLICISDHSFNASLFFLNRDGWTNFKPIRSADKIEFLRSKGAGYLVVQDRDKESNSFLEGYMTNEIGRIGDVAIYKL